jgi:SAM-dependent methyltransferase
MSISPTTEIKLFFSKHRIAWMQFYPSERQVVEKIWNPLIRNVLDIGCGCAGLFSALEERFGDGKIKYVGVELDKEAADYAAKLFEHRAKIINSDFDSCEFDNNEMFDVVFSLSCFDWNTNLASDSLKSFYTMFKKSWNMVADGGYLVISLRLDVECTIMDAEKSYQYINYSGKKEGNIANYSVISVDDCFKLFRQHDVCSITGYGYYGAPGVTAVTPFETICFGVFALKKQVGYNDAPGLDFNFPAEIAEIFKKQADESC